jgi:hypothetical protein
MPPELIQTLGLRIPTLRRDPHYFLPTTGDRRGGGGAAGAPGRRGGGVRAPARATYITTTLQLWYPPSHKHTRTHAHTHTQTNTHARTHMRAAAPVRYLLFGSDQASMREQFLKFFSREDWDANQAMQARPRGRARGRRGGAAARWGPWEAPHYT